MGSLLWVGYVDEARVGRRMCPTLDEQHDALGAFSALTRLQIGSAAAAAAQIWVVSVIA